MARAQPSRFLKFAAVLLVAVAGPNATLGDEVLINLEWRPAPQTVFVDDPVGLGLYAVSADSELTQLFRALDLVFSWDPNYLQLDGLDQSGAVPLLSSGFPANDLHGLNEVVPPADGDGYYKAWAHLGQPVVVDPAGVLLTTFLFTALAPTDATQVVMEVSGGSPVLETTVWGGPGANTNVTGTLDTGVIEIIPEPATLILLVLGGLALPRRR